MYRQGDAKEQQAAHAVTTHAQKLLTREQLVELYRLGIALEPRETRELCLSTAGGPVRLRFGCVGAGVVGVAVVERDELAQNVLNELMSYSVFFVREGAQASHRGKFSGQTQQSIAPGNRL